MNMKELFSQYKEMNPSNKYDNDYTLFGIATVIVIVVVGYLFFRYNLVIYLLITISLTFLFILVFNVAFYIKELKQTLTKDEKENIFSDKFRIYLNKIKRKRINNLRKILKNSNINSKKDIEMTINYFENRRLKLMYENILSSSLKIMLMIATMMFIEERINYDILDGLTELLIIIFSPLVIIYGFKFLHFIFIGLIKKEGKECFIEDLYYIYYNSKIE